MKKELLLSIALLISSLIFSKNVKVTLKLINNTNQKIDVRIDKTSNINSSNTETIKFFGMEATKDEIEVPIPDQKRYSFIVCYAELEKGGRTKKEYRLVENKKNVFTVIFSVEKGTEASLVDLSLNGQMLKYDPKKFLNKNISPKPISGLYSSYLGGIAVYVKTNDNIDSLVTTITPFQLGTIMASGKSFGVLTDTKEIFFYNQKKADIDVKVPLITNLNVAWKSNTFYKVKIEYSGVGIIDWKPEIGQPSLSEAMDSLSRSDLYDLGYFKSKYGERLKLKQINKAYVFDALFIEINEGKNLSTDAEVNISTFVSGAGNFELEQKAKDKKIFGSSYVGYWFDQAAQDKTGFLDKALAIYLDDSKNNYVGKSEIEVLTLYSKQRELDPSLPDLKTKKEIIKFFDEEILGLIDKSNILNEQFLDKFQLDKNNKNELGIPREINKLDKNKIPSSIDLKNIDENYILKRLRELNKKTNINENE